MISSGSHIQVPRYPGFHCHPEAHVGSGGTPDSRPAQAPERDPATTPESTTLTTARSGTGPTPDGNATRTATVN